MQALFSDASATIQGKFITRCVDRVHNTNVLVILVSDREIYNIRHIQQKLSGKSHTKFAPNVNLSSP